MKKKTRKKVIRRKRRSMREKRVMRIKRGLMKRAKKLRLGAKRTGAYVYGTLRRIVGNGPYSRTILKVLKSPIEAYSRGKRIPDLYEALLIRFGNGELGIMIGWRNRNGELIQTPGAWTLDSLKGVSDSIAIDYGQGWTVRGMHGAIAEAKSDALYRIRDLKRNPGFDPNKIIGGAKARKEYYAGLKSGLESRKEMDGGSKWTHLIVGQKNKNDRYLSNVTLREALDRPLIFAYQMGWRTGWNKGWANESYMPRLRGNPMRSSFDKPTFGPMNTETRRVDTTTMAGMKEAERLQRAGWYQGPVTLFSTTYYRKRALPKSSIARQIRGNPPMYAHRMMSHRTHGLSLKQMMKLYRLVSSGNPKAVMFARRTLGIPMSESLSQVKAVVYHHVLDLKGKI